MPASRRAEAEALARHLVERFAPHELATFELEAAPCLRDPRGMMKAYTRTDDTALGSGLSSVIATFTPAAALVASAALGALGQSIAVSATARLKAGVQRLRGRSAQAAPVAAPQQEELRAIHRRSLETAMALGFDEHKARAVADAVLAALVVDRA